jgi:hypothetical protein
MADGILEEAKTTGTLSFIKRMTSIVRDDSALSLFKRVPSMSVQTALILILDGNDNTKNLLAHQRSHLD